MAEEKLTPLQSELLNRADTIFGAIRDAAVANGKDQTIMIPHGMSVMNIGK
jgi:hypothetical protein